MLLWNTRIFATHHTPAHEPGQGVPSPFRAFVRRYGPRGFRRSAPTRFFSILLKAWTIGPGLCYGNRPIGRPEGGSAISHSIRAKATEMRGDILQVLFKPLFPGG